MSLTLGIVPAFLSGLFLCGLLSAEDQSDKKTAQEHALAMIVFAVCTVRDNFSECS